MHPIQLFSDFFSRGGRSRIHLYDVYDNELGELNEAPPTSRSIFADIACNSDGEPITITEETRRIYDDAEEAFNKLQEDAMVTIDSITYQLQPPPDILELSTSDMCSVPDAVTLPRSGLSQLRRYLVFVRFRNSPGYSTILWRLRASEAGATAHASAFKHFLIRMKRRYMLECFADFLRGDDRRWSRGHLQELGLSSDSKFVGLVRDIMERYCWGLLEAEICLGLTEEEHEFIIPSCCYGILDDGTEEERYVLPPFFNRYHSNPSICAETSQTSSFPSLLQSPYTFLGNLRWARKCFPTTTHRH